MDHHGPKREDDMGGTWLAAPEKGAGSVRVLRSALRRRRRRLLFGGINPSCLSLQLVGVQLGHHLPLAVESCRLRR